MKYHERARAIFAADRLSQSDRLILLAISDHVGSDGGWAWPSAGGLAEKCAMSERGVRKRLQAMVEAGALIEEKRPGYSSRLLICWDTLSGHSMRLRLVCEDAHTPEPRSPRNDVHPGTTFRTTPEPRSGPPGTTFRTPRNDVPTNGKGTDQGTDQETDLLPKYESGSSAGTESADAESPDKSGRDEWVDDLWWKLNAIRKQHKPGAQKLALTPERRRSMKLAAKKLREAGMTRDDLLTAATWVHVADTPNCRGARDTGNAIGVLLRPSHVVDYCEKAREGEGMPASGGQGRASDATEADRAWRQLLANLNSHGLTAIDNAPPRIKAAVAAAGGLRAITSATHDIERERHRKAFVAAYQEAA